MLDFIADYISKKQGRIPGEDLLFRPEANNTLWIDDLYMSCPFLIRRAKQTGQSALLDDAAKQMLAKQQIVQRLQRSVLAVAEVAGLRRPTQRGSLPIVFRPL